ncbi:hypothetical protein B0H19DRAFT_1131544 [Mycena capillaripes]|nr:hypothetical protein B0H19DRAFT_1131544 [Mycena capillaripes]
MFDIHDFIRRENFECPPGLEIDVYHRAGKPVAAPSTCATLADVQVELNKLASSLSVVCLSKPSGKKRKNKKKKKKADGEIATAVPPLPPTQELDFFRPYVIIDSKIDTETNTLSVSLFAPTFFHETSEEFAGDIWVDVSKLRIIPEGPGSRFPWRDPESTSNIITLDWERDCAQRVVTMDASMLRQHHGHDCPICMGSRSIMYHLDRDGLKNNWPKIKLPSRLGDFHVPCPSCIGVRAIESVSDWSPFMDEEGYEIWHLWWAIMKMDESWLKASDIEEMQAMGRFVRNIAEEEYYSVCK